MSTNLLLRETVAAKEAAKLKTIVCGTDFTVQAQEASDAAAALAERAGAALVLVHAYDSSPAPIDPNLFRAGSSKAEEELVKEAKRLRNAGSKVEQEFTAGNAAAALVETAIRREAELIVVASRGMVAPAQFISASVAERTAENSPVPTLVVRDKGGFQNWAEGRRPLKIFVAYDFSRTADDALVWLRKMRGIGPCEVTVGYAAYPPQESWRLGVGGDRSLDELPAEIQRIVQRDLTERITEILGTCQFNVRVEPVWSKPDPVLLALAKEVDADLIIVGTHQRNGFGRFWLGSVSRSILRNSRCSVAIVPRSAFAKKVRNIPAVRRVLVTTDFSDCGNRAIPHAYSLLASGGTVCLLHVKAPGGNKGPAYTKLRGLLPTDADQSDIAGVVEVVESDRPAEAICQTAERFGADIICIASHGRSGISKVLMGSVARDVMSRSTRPVLVIKAFDE